MTPTQQHRLTLTAMYVGMVLTVAAAITPYVDRATGHVLASHIRAGYPAYSQDQVDSAVTKYLILLTTVGALGLCSWVWTTWAVTSGKPWARPVTTAMFALGSSVALTTLLVKDTSGETGLAPLLGWIGMLPCLAGLGAVVLLWARHG